MLNKNSESLKSTTPPFFKHTIFKMMVVYRGARVRDLPPTTKNHQPRAEIPFDCLSVMTEFCDFRTVCMLAEVSKFFRVLCARDSIWDNLCLHHFLVETTEITKRPPKRLYTTPRESYRNKTTSISKTIFVKMKQNLRQTLLEASHAARCRFIASMRPANIPTKIQVK